MAGGGKVATWTGSGTGSTVSSISFTVDAQPDEWVAVCVGPASGSFNWTGTSAPYLVVNVGYCDWLGAETKTLGGAFLRITNSRVRINPISTSPTVNVTSSYSNGVLTLTCDSNRQFMNYGTSANITYLLFYTT